MNRYSEGVHHFPGGRRFRGRLPTTSNRVRASLRPIDPRGQGLRVKGDRVRPETARPPMPGWKTWADVSVRRGCTHALLCDRGKRVPQISDEEDIVELRMRVLSDFARVMTMGRLEEMELSAGMGFTSRSSWRRRTCSETELTPRESDLSHDAS